MPTKEEILDHFLSLPDEWRLVIAEELIESLEWETIPPDARQELKLKASRRLEAVTSGIVDERPAREILERLHQKLELWRRTKTTQDSAGHEQRP